MRLLNWKVLVLLASAFGNVHAQSLRSGGCSDLYGTAPVQTSETSQDKLSDNDDKSRVHLVGFGHHGHGGGHGCGLFRRGGCSVGSCGAPVPFGLPAAGFYSAPLVANQPAVFYQAPTYYQAPGFYQAGGFNQGFGYGAVGQGFGPGIGIGGAGFGNAGFGGTGFGGVGVGQGLGYGTVGSAYQRSTYQSSSSVQSTTTYYGAGAQGAVLDGGLYAPGYAVPSNTGNLRYGLAGQAPGYYQGPGYEFSAQQPAGYYQAPGYSYLQGAGSVQGSSGLGGACGGIGMGGAALNAYSIGPAYGYQSQTVYPGALGHSGSSAGNVILGSGACAPGVSQFGNAILNYGNTIQGTGSGYGAVVVPTGQRSLIDCGPVTSYKVVLEPKYFTETREVPSTEYQNETRYRTRTVPRTVPIETQDYRAITTIVPRSETKTIEYTVLVPQTGEKSVEVVETVPVWSDVSEQYTVRVPTVVEVPEEYKVRVPQLVDQEFTYTVQVPQSQTETRMQTVTNAVPVTRTRTIQVLQPVTRTQTVTKDYGHWETYVEEVAAPAPSVGCATVGGYSAAPAVNYGVSYGGGSHCGSGHGCGLLGRHHGCGLFRRGGCGASASSCGGGGCGLGGGCGAGGCGGVGGCGSHGIGGAGCGQAVVTYGVPTQSYAPATQTISRRVWVPNVVTEEVSVVENVPQSQEIAYTVFEQKSEQVPYEYTYLVYRPEIRTGTRKVVTYTEETRTRARKVVQYSDEVRTRTRKQLSYKQETRTQTIPVVSYVSEKRTKEVTYTFNVPETKVEPFTSTRYETINDEVTEEYTVQVPVTTTKTVQVQVCRMVPKLVPVTIYPSSGTIQDGYSAGGIGYGGVGYGGVGVAPMVAPGYSIGGCAGCASGCNGCR